MVYYAPSIRSLFLLAVLVAIVNAAVHVGRGDNGDYDSGHGHGHGHGLRPSHTPRPSHTNTCAPSATPVKCVAATLTFSLLTILPQLLRMPRQRWFGGSGWSYF
jgi:hypothetical protein